MNKMITLCIVAFLFSLAIPVCLFASRPVDYLLVGCVQDGMLFSLRTAVFKVGSSPETRANWIRVRPPSVNLAPYEGKKIGVRGFLHPGDLFQPDLNTLETLGICDEEANLAVRRELPQAYKRKAKEQAGQGDWDTAWNYINKAIKLDNSDCSLLFTRAEFYQQQGKIQEAVQDAQQAVDYGCRRYPDLAFLAELLERVGNKPAAIAAYKQALTECEYKPDKERFQQRIILLKSSTHTDPQKKGSQAQGGKLPPTATDPEAMPLPPPLRD